MSFHKITARMLDNRVEVETTDNRYAVFQFPIQFQFQERESERKIGVW